MTTRFELPMDLLELQSIITTFIICNTKFCYCYFPIDMSPTQYLTHHCVIRYSLNYHCFI